MGGSNSAIGLLAASGFRHSCSTSGVFLVEAVRRRRAVCIVAEALSRLFSSRHRRRRFAPKGEIALTLVVIGLFCLSSFGAIAGCSWNSWMLIRPGASPRHVPGQAPLDGRRIERGPELRGRSFRRCVDPVAAGRQSLRLRRARFRRRRVRRPRGTQLLVAVPEPPMAPATKRGTDARAATAAGRPEFPQVDDVPGHLESRRQSGPRSSPSSC